MRYLCTNYSTIGVVILYMNQATFCKFEVFRPELSGTFPNFHYLSRLVDPEFMAFMYKK